MLECGRRFARRDFAESAWNLRRYFWMPRLGLRGIFRLTVFKDVFIVSGNGVGGGSLGYANTLYRARPAFFATASGTGSPTGRRELRPHYETAERMLGVDRLRGHDRRRRAAASEYGEEIGVGETFKPHPGRDLLRRARQGGRRPVLRRRGTAAHRLRPLRRAA